DLLDRYYAAVRSELGRFRGRELDTARDGMFASFEGLRSEGGSFSGRRAGADRVANDVRQIPASPTAARPPPPAAAQPSSPAESISPMARRCDRDPSEGNSRNVAQLLERVRVRVQGRVEDSGLAQLAVLPETLES